jgi:exosortase A-associated hydrolase 2
MTTLQERPFFFKNGSQRIFAVLHTPQGVARNYGFVFCYPGFEEKLWVHRVFVSFARELAARGYHVLRFDFAGHGDSEGNFEDTSVASQLSDIDSAVRALSDELGQGGTVGLLGLRLGAALAASYAEQHASIDTLILWDPVVNGAQYMQELLLSNLATQSAVYGEIRQTREELSAQMQSGGIVNIEGYELGRTLFNEVNALSLAGEKRFQGKCLIAQIGRAVQKPKKDLEVLRASYVNAELALVAEEPFWKEIKTFYPRADNLFAATLEWFDRHGK